MQGRLRDGYAYLGGQQRVAVVPVGDTFSWALGLRPSLGLWDSDGHHPSLEGSYLAAATFNAALDVLEPQRGHAAGPAGSTFTAGLDAGAAAWLRQVANVSVRRTLG
jgi:hypothetical protein